MGSECETEGGVALLFKHRRADFILMVRSKQDLEVGPEPETKMLISISMLTTC